MIRVDRFDDVITVSGNPEQFKELAYKMKLKRESLKLGSSLEVESFVASDGSTVLKILVPND